MKGISFGTASVTGSDYLSMPLLMIQISLIHFWNQCTQLDICPSRILLHALIICIFLLKVWRSNLLRWLWQTRRERLRHPRLVSVLGIQTATRSLFPSLSGWLSAWVLLIANAKWFPWTSGANLSWLLGRTAHGSNFSAVNSFDPCQSASLCLELFNLKET